MKSVFRDFHALLLRLTIYKPPPEYFFTHFDAELLPHAFEHDVDCLETKLRFSLAVPISSCFGLPCFSYIQVMSFCQVQCNQPLYHA